jgi:hypothetical protein
MKMQPRVTNSSGPALAFITAMFSLFTDVTEVFVVSLFNPPKVENFDI